MRFGRPPNISHQHWGLLLLHADGVSLQAHCTEQGNRTSESQFRHSREVAQTPRPSLELVERTNTLRTLLPEYVSTVDSGNFWGCLLALKHGLTELAQWSEGHASASALTALVEPIEALVQPIGFPVPLQQGAASLFNWLQRLHTSSRQ